MKGVTSRITEAAEIVVGPRPDHRKECDCAECIDWEARVQVERDRIANRVEESLVESERQEAEQRASDQRHADAARAAETVTMIDRVLDKLEDSAGDHLHRAGRLARENAGRRMSDTDYQTWARAERRAVDLAEDRRALRKEKKRAERRAAKARVKAEPRVYALDSPNSFFRDQAVRLTDAAGVHAAEAERRLAQYGAELAYEIRRGTKEGKRARRLIREATRHEHEKVHRERFEAELRSLTTGGGATASATSGASSFVPPFFINQAWAPFRGIERSFADQCAKCPMPDYGMEIYIPLVSSTTAAAQQTEGAAVTESVPSTALEGAQLKTVTGQLTITRQLHDRGYTGGGAFDAVIGQQIQQQLDQEVDLYALTQAITNGVSVAGQASYKTANLYQDIAKGREKLTDTAGTRLRPTHFFTTSDLYSYATRQVDATTERPIITPQFTPGFPLTKGADPFDGGPKPQWARFTGTVLPGGLLWFTSDNIPAFGTTSQTQLLVSAPEVSIVLAEAPPILSVFVEALAAKLEVIVNLRSYVAAVTRHASGTAIITSAAYTQALI